MGDMTWLFLQWCKNHMRWFAGIFPCNRNIWGHHSYLLLCIRKASYTMSKQAICGCSDSVEPKWLGNAAKQKFTWSAKLESTHAPWLRNGGRPRLLCSCLVPCNKPQANGRAKQTVHCDLEILSHKFCFVQLEWFWDVFWECLVIRLGITHIQTHTVSISFAYMSVDAYFCIWLSDYILGLQKLRKQCFHECK